MRWKEGALVAMFLCAGCGGGGGTTTDAGGEVADVPRDVVDVPPDIGPEIEGDAEDVEAGADANVEDVPEDVGADLPEVTKRSVLTVTSGGGTARGGSYGLTLTIGTPQPMGTGSSAGYHGSVGPSAVLGQ